MSETSLISRRCVDDVMTIDEAQSAAMFNLASGVAQSDTLPPISTFDLRDTLQVLLNSPQSYFNLYTPIDPAVTTTEELYCGGGVLSFHSREFCFISLQIIALKLVCQFRYCYKICHFLVRILGLPQFTDIYIYRSLCIIFSCTVGNFPCIVIYKKNFAIFASPPLLQTPHINN